MRESKPFHHPVDPVALNIPDYLEVIKTPMDFSTIKKKLATNQYVNGEEYLKDMKQVFYNCELFNGNESDVGKLGVIVR